VPPNSSLAKSAALIERHAAFLPLSSPTIQMTDTYRFIEPLDVLFLRGNKLFGDPGSHGETLMPPWPSVAAGALRSHMLATEGIDLQAFARGSISHPSLGTPQAPGSFAITAFHLARRTGAQSAETLHALPADLVVTRPGGGAQRKAHRLRPTEPAPGLESSAPLSRWPVLPVAARDKAETGLWMRQSGWARYLAGDAPAPDELLDTADLWQADPRIGIGLDAAAHRASDGALFSAQAVAFRPDIGFLVGVQGAEPPARGVVRLGGDGRGAALDAVPHRPAQPDLRAIAAAGRARIVLTTPGLFADGWLPPGLDADRRLALAGLRARLVCAAVPRAEVASGWDLAQRAPKPAQRMAPAGSVYWLDALEATPEALGKLAAHGLWAPDADNSQRRAEGFNRFTFAAW